MYFPGLSGRKNPPRESAVVWYCDANIEIFAPGSARNDVSPMTPLNPPRAETVTTGASTLATGTSANTAVPPSSPTFTRWTCG